MGYIYRCQAGNGARRQTENREMNEFIAEVFHAREAKFEDGKYYVTYDDTDNWIDINDVDEAEMAQADELETER